MSWYPWTVSFTAHPPPTPPSHWLEWSFLCPLGTVLACTSVCPYAQLQSPHAAVNDVLMSPVVYRTYQEIIQSHKRYSSSSYNFKNRGVTSLPYNIRYLKRSEIIQSFLFFNWIWLVDFHSLVWLVISLLHSAYLPLHLVFFNYFMLKDEEGLVIYNCQCFTVIASSFFGNLNNDTSWYLNCGIQGRCISRLQAYLTGKL